MRSQPSMNRATRSNQEALLVMQEQLQQLMPTKMSILLTVKISCLSTPQALANEEMQDQVGQKRNRHRRVWSLSRRQPRS